MTELSDGSNKLAGPLPLVGVPSRYRPMRLRSGACGTQAARPAFRRIESFSRRVNDSACSNRNPGEYREVRKDT